MWWMLMMLACNSGGPSAEAHDHQAGEDHAHEGAKKHGDKAHGDKAHGDKAHGDKAAAIGAPAPAFTLTDLDGKKHSLADYKGKTVVLEWFNPGCPFVVQAHEPEGLLEDAASRLTASGDVVWLAINSGAPGKQGHGADANKKAAKGWSMKNPILLDESGEVGHLYGAVTTPQMAVIDAKGTLAYMGALSNAPRGKVDGTLRKHLEVALSEVRQGKPVTVAKTKPWGCGVKY